MMDARTIQQELRRWAANHKYLLVNAYVFAWESDFFSVTKNGTVYEVEVKISRTDFFKDFKKDKHRLFEALTAKKKFTVLKSGYGSRGDHLFDVIHRKIHLETYMRRQLDVSFTHQEDSFGYWQRRERFVHLHEHRYYINAPATGIDIIELSKRHIPNRFYYACPAGIIRKEDIPPYAGLLHITEDGVDMIKQAPFIHKGNLFEGKLPAILLEKFWYLSQEQRYKLVHHNIDFKDCYENKTTEA